MKKFRLLLLSVPILFVSFHSARKADHATDVKKWVSLFNGKNLAGWIPKFAGHTAGENFNNTFRVQDGMLSTRYDQYDSFNNRFGALYFDKKFTNYRLRVEYRFTGTLTPGAPSWGFQDGGIQYHCQAPATVGIDQPFPVCLEYNILGGTGKTERPSGEICCSGMYVYINGKKNTLYCTPPTVKRTVPGEDWTIAEIEVRDGKITHFINGEPVLTFDNPHYDSTHSLGKQFIVKGDDVVHDGYISLQSNSHPMDFRKIEIMEY